MICAPTASSSAGVSPFTVACVPTGMNTGVSTSPWGKVRTPARARLSVLRASVRNLATATAVLAPRGRIADGRASALIHTSRVPSPPRAGEGTSGGQRAAPAGLPGDGAPPEDAGQPRVRALASAVVGLDRRRSGAGRRRIDPAGVVGVDNYAQRLGEQLVGRGQGVPGQGRLGDLGIVVPARRVTRVAEPGDHGLA